MKKIFFASALLLSACAGTGANYRPIIDSKGADMNRFEVDLHECQQYATQTADAATAAAVGAGIGAVMGVALGAIVGKGYDRRAITGVAALTGAAEGAVAGENSQRGIIRKCLVGRGYSVLQ